MKVKLFNLVAMTESHDFYSFYYIMLMVRELSNFFFFLFMAVPEAYRIYQAKGQIRAAASGLCRSHGNIRSELHR